MQRDGAGDFLARGTGCGRHGGGEVRAGVVVVGGACVGDPFGLLGGGEGGVGGAFGGVEVVDVEVEGLAGGAWGGVGCGGGGWGGGGVGFAGEEDRRAVEVARCALVGQWGGFLSERGSGGGSGSGES